MLRLSQEVESKQCAQEATEVLFWGKVRSLSWIDEILIFRQHEESYVLVNDIVCTVSAHTWMLRAFVKECEGKAVSHFSLYEQE